VKARLATVLAVAAPLIFLGCGKDDGPIKPPTPQPIVYPDQSTPKNTVLRMSMAVANRDSVVTASVYADDYEGSSNDLDGPIPEAFTFTKADEIRVIGAMALSNSIVSVDMDLGHPATWFQHHFVSDPPDWVTIEVPGYRIYVNDVDLGEFGMQSPSAGETRIFEFRLRPTTPDSTSPTDTTWTIVRWTEIRNLN